MDLIELLAASVREDASDLHLSAGVAPMIRRHGTMRPLSQATAARLTAEELQRLVYSGLRPDQIARFEQDDELDFSLEVAGTGRFRGNAFRHLRGIGAVYRVIPDKPPTLAELGMPPILADLMRRERGLVLVTGATGSGKSTTLAAMLDHYNRTTDGHVITIEDPIEYVHPPRRSLVNQREVGSTTKSFSAALRAALREDPDVLLVGELRDLETISLALTAAETGHLVLGTLHTSGAAQTVSRVVDVFPEGEQSHVQTLLASSLAAVVSQALLPSTSGGRVAAQEILVGTSAVSALIREGRTHQLTNVLQTGMRFGMQTLEQSLRRLVMEGRVARETAADCLRALGRAPDEERPEASPPRHEHATAVPQREPRQTPSVTRSRTPPQLAGRGPQGNGKLDEASRRAAAAVAARLSGRDRPR